MSFASAVPTKHSLSQLSSGQGPLTQKSEPKPNMGGLEDFINELNQATNLRLQIQDDVAQEGRLKIKKNPEPQGSKEEQKASPELQILQNPDGLNQNPAKIADSNEVISESTKANILAALQQIQLQGQFDANRLLSNWSSGQAVQSSNNPVEMANTLNMLDLGDLRANLKNLGLDNILSNLEKARLEGNLQEANNIQANLVQSLLEKLATLNSQQDSYLSNQALAHDQLNAKADAKALMALISQRQQALDDPALDPRMNLVKVNALNVEKSPEAITNQIDLMQPSLTQELKIKELRGLDQRFTLTQTTLKTGDSATEVIDSSPDTAIAQSVLGQKPTFELMPNGMGSPKLKPETDLSLTDDLSGNLQTASQVAQQSVNISTPTQIALSLHEASVVSGPLHQEIMTAAKAGGGRIQLELTPPEQGTLRIDLRIDQSGKAHLIVEGANDAAKSRLDQGGQQLKNEFAQMGLNLTLDLRQGESHFGQGRQFAENQTRLDPSFSTDRSSRGIGLLSEKFANERLNGAYGQGGSGIHLYA